MAETKVTLLNVVDRGVFDSISDEDKQGNIYFVREGTPTNTNMLSLYVGTSKQCDVLDISDVPGIDLNNEYNNYNIPEQYQIKNKLLFIEQSDSVDNNTTFYKALMWNGEKFLDCFGTPRNVIVCENLPSYGIVGYVYIELFTRKIYIYENGFISLVSNEEYATNEYVLSVYNTLLNIISQMSTGGAPSGAALLIVNGGVSDIGGDTRAATELLSGEIPLINAVRYPVGNAVGNVMICDAREMRCTAKEIYEIPAGKVATVSCAVSGMQITGWQMNDRFICTGNSFSTWQDFPLVIDNTTGSESMFAALNFRRSDNSDVSPSDFGTIVATLE